MPGQNLWPSITAIDALLDRDRVASEEAVDQMETELRKFNKNQRDEMRHRISVIVAQLARVELRMVEAYGPVGVG